MNCRLQDALNHVLKDNWAIFLESPLVKYYASQNCDLQVVGSPFALRPYGFAMQQNSPFKNDLDRV